MRPPAPQSQDEARGFILVGVVTFMLALTILGLSLFALSSYEAQFFAASATREQALQNCESGMGLVQTLLESQFPRNLENARLAVGQFGVTSAIAYQPRDKDVRDTLSTGPVDWDKSVFIVVRAKSGGSERSLYAEYTPEANANPYQRLITANAGITYNNENSTSQSQFRIRGRVWQYVQSSSDTAWTDDVTWTSGRPVEPSQTPLPMADAFVDEKSAGPLYTPSSFYEEASADDGKPKYTLTLSNPSSTPRFFHSPVLDPKDEDTPNEAEFEQYSFYSYPSVTVKVRGTVIWIVPQGFCIRRTLTVEPDDEEDRTPPTLIIVSKANRRDPGYENRGIWLQGALKINANNEDVYPRVYLVSEADIGVTHRHSAEHNKRAEYVSIVAGGAVEIGGPKDEDDVFRLGYDPAAMDAAADQLLLTGALPPAAGGSATAFARIRGTWRETTPP